MDDSLSRDVRTPSNAHLAVRALVLSASLVFMLCTLLEPIWETNDDVQLSMITHGYGVVTTGSPKLVFSNVLWGYVIRSIPEVNGTLGYSIVTLAILIVVGTVVAYGFLRLELGLVAAISALMLLLGRPILIPQYTINAGLLMVGAIICWNFFEQQQDKRALIIGCCLAYCSYLIRSQEFLLVLGVALPLLPWGALRSDRAPKIAFAALIVVIGVSAGIDHQAYQDPEWRAFNELNAARLPFNDFGAGDHLKQRPDILNRSGFSDNDIDLITNWFFADPNIAHPKKLNAMLEELGPLATQKDSLHKAWGGLEELWSSQKLFPIVLAALLLAVLRPSWRVVCVWGLCIAAVFTLGLLGRPGVTRVYIPLVSLLLIAPFLAKGKGQKGQGIWRHWAAVGVIIVAALLNAFTVFSDSKTLQAWSKEVRTGLSGSFPTFPVVVWAGNFPYEAVYPVLNAPQSAMSYRLYMLDVFTLAPYSVASAEKGNGRGMTDLLIGESGVPIIANEYALGLLDIYCKEHLNGKLKQMSRRDYGPVALRRYRCEIAYGRALNDGGESPDR